MHACMYVCISLGSSIFFDRPRDAMSSHKDGENYKVKTAKLQSQLQKNWLRDPT